MQKIVYMHLVNLKEKKIRNNFSKATILRPSVIYSVDDNFTTNLMSLLNLMPFFQFIIMVIQNFHHYMFLILQKLFY